MSGARFCVCCGMESTNRHLFKRANTEAPGQRLGYGNDDWICRNYQACADRGVSPMETNQ